MSTNAKTCPQKPARKAACKFATPISNDRAEAFVGPRADIEPRFSEIPSERDKQAFELAAKGMTQREIAKKLKISQPTVHRAIQKYRRWFGTTLPEDRGELVGFARFRVAVEERRLFLRHLQELAIEEWHESRRPVPMKRKRTKIDPEGRKLNGMSIKDIQIDEWVQKRHATASHLNAAAKRSLELTTLEAGYLGVHKLSCNQAIDPDERDRWDRCTKSRDAKIEELTRKVAELEAKLAAKNSTPHAPREEILSRSERSTILAPREEAFTRSVKSTLDESRTAPTTPSLNQTPPVPDVASPVDQMPSGNPSDSSPPVLQGVNQMNQNPSSGGQTRPPVHAQTRRDPEVIRRLMQIRMLNSRP